MLMYVENLHQTKTLLNSVAGCRPSGDSNPSGVLECLEILEGYEAKTEASEPCRILRTEV